MTNAQAQHQKALIEIAFVAVHNELMEQHQAGKIPRREYERAANKVNRWAEGKRNEIAQTLYNAL